VNDQGAFLISFLANLALTYMLLWQQRRRAKVEDAYKAEIYRLRRQLAKEE
jgi:hypothetical protein